jgi:dolichol-phosphate mannosyltransferase
METSPSTQPVEVSVVVPALNEAGNLPALIERIAVALAGRAYEVIIVDDGSEDGTPQVCAALANRFPVALLVRPHAADGLSGAVLHGLRLAQGQFLAVMDADLQHPPERLPDLLAPLERDHADFTVGSRYVSGGSTAGEWNWLRRINSHGATLLARPFAGRTRDPMSGFFALRRETFLRARDLEPMGYKIALELMCKCGVSRVIEVPIHFDARREGTSKLTVAQQVKYLEH